MRDRMSCLGIALGLVLAAAPHLAGASSGRCYVISSVDFTNLTGVPGIEAQYVELALRDLCHHHEIYHALPKGSRLAITGVDCTKTESPFVSQDDHEGCRGINLQIDCEQVHYGRIDEDVKAGLTAYYLAGVWSLITPGNMGKDGALVEYRARVWANDGGDTLIVVGTGRAAGHIAAFPRRVAVNEADRRALYDLFCTMIETMDKQWSLSLPSKRVTMSDDDFERLAKQSDADPAGPLLH